MNRRIIGVVAAVLLAAVGTAFLVTFVRGAEERALAGQETVEVLVVDQDVTRGTPASELGDAISTQRIPAKVLANGSIASLEDLDGQVTAVDLIQGEQLVASRFSDPAQLEAESEVEIPEGLQEVTISIAPHRALGGKVAPGDLVGLFASFNLDDEREEEDIANEEQEQLRQELSETSKLLLNKLLVTNVQVEQLPQAPGDEDDGESNGPELAPTGNLLVTLAVDVPQAERIVFAAEYGTTWLSAQDENTSEDGSRIRTPRNIYDD